MALAPDLSSFMAQRVTQLWRWAGWEHQKDFALAISDDDTLVSKLKKGGSLTTERVLRIAQESAGRQNVIDDPGTVLLFLFGLKEEADVWVPSVRLVETTSEAILSTPADSTSPGSLNDSLAA